jgi:hypothetical protein
MKAVQIATSLTSVYAIDEEGQVRHIERGTDGFWGPWQGTAVAARRIAHGGTVVAVIGPDGRLAALPLTANGAWTTWDRQAAEVCPVHVAGHGPTLFLVDRNMAWHARTDAPDAPWSGWEPLGGPVHGIDATALPGGGLALFGLRDGAVCARWQTPTDGSWSDWTPLGAPAGGATRLRAGNLAGGGLVVFALGTDGRISHRWQDEPHARWQPWEDLGGSVAGFSVARGPRGGLALFAVAVDGEVLCRWQAKPFGDWSPWMALGGRARSVTAQTSYTDGLEVFAIGLDGEVRHKWCERLDWPWTEWTPLTHERSPLRLDRDPLPQAAND